MTKIELPEQFDAFAELGFCSNTLLNCKTPIVMDRSPILLVGKGDQPQVWLWGIVNPKIKELVQVVYSNSVRIFTAPIVVESRNNSTCVRLNEIIIIKAVKQSDDNAIIEQIDLRPLGFNIHGDSNALNIGTNVVKGTMISGCGSFIALGV